MVGGVAGFTAEHFWTATSCACQKNIRRLMDRWPAMVRSAGRLPPSGNVRMTRAGRRQNALLDATCQTVFPSKNFFGLCCDNREGDRGGSLCLQVRVCSTPVIDGVPVASSDIENVLIQRMHGPGHAFFRAR